MFHFPCRVLLFCILLLAISSQELSISAKITPATDFEIVHEYPHDPKAFTEGLIFFEGNLYESTGNYGESNLRKVALASGQVLQQTNLSVRYFGEGLTALQGKLYQLTWQENVVFVYDAKTFALETNFNYPGEGWGLTTDGQALIMSDGSAKISFLDPATFQVQRSIKVTDHGHAVKYLNELEFIKGQIFANLWQSDDVVIIDPATGKVMDRINFGRLRSYMDNIRPLYVLNGIAYDATTDRLFITGKNWPKLFEIRLKQSSNLSN